MKTIKKLRVIEDNQLDFHPSQNLTDRDLQHLRGGLCNYLDFMINDFCACDKNCFLRTGKPPKGY